MMPPVRHRAERDSRRLLTGLAVGLLLAAPASAQISTDQVARNRIVPTKNQVKEDAETYHFRLGPLRLAPVLELNNVGYDSNVFGLPPPLEVARWTASATFGFKWLVPAGSKFYVVGQAVPTYIWYQDLAIRSFFGGNYSAYLLGFFNRASLEVGGFNSKGLQFISSEAQTPVIQTTLDGSAKVEVDVASNFSIYARAEVARLRFGDSGFGVGVIADTSGLQRTEGALGGGVRYRFSSAFSAALGYEKTRTEFVFDPQSSDNQSDAYLVNIRYDRPRFYVNLSGGYRRGEPWNGSTFASYATPTGGYFMSYRLTSNLELRAYGDRRVTYGILIPQFLQSRYGGGINFELFPKVQLRAFGVWGTNAYGATNVEGTMTPGHTDKTLDYGGGVVTTIFRKVAWSTYATESTLTSPVPGLNRNALRVLTSLSFDALFNR